MKGGVDERKSVPVGYLANDLLAMLNLDVVCGQQSVMLCSHDVKDSGYIQGSKWTLDSAESSACPVIHTIHTHV